VVVALAAAMAGCGSDDPAGSATTDPPPSVTAPGAGDGELPARDADVTGVVGTGDEYQSPPYLVEPSDGYYLGMSLVPGMPAITSPGDPIIVDVDGSAITALDLKAGDEVAVWTGEACAESFPVQCDIVAIQVTQPS
jgi:hypothetical protein